MSKSKRKTYTPQGKEADHLNTQAGLGNVGEALDKAIDGAMKPDDAEIKKFNDLITEIQERFPDQYVDLSDDAISIAETDSIAGAIKFLINELNKLDDQANAEKPAEVPVKDTPKPQTAKANLHWSANPSAAFNNALNELVGMFVDTNQPECAIEQYRDSVLGQPTEDDAIKMIEMTKQQFNENLKKIEETVLNNNTNPKMEETKMNNENNTNAAQNNVNAQAPVVDAAALAAMQNAAVAQQPKASGSALTTTEKVILYTAAGVAVTALIFGVIAIAKANRANARITDLELSGSNDIL